MKEKENYISPKIEVLSARVECGFTLSGTDIDANGVSTQQMEGGTNDYRWN